MTVFGVSLTLIITHALAFVVGGLCAWRWGQRSGQGEALLNKASDKVTAAGKK